MRFARLSAKPAVASGAMAAAVSLLLIIVATAAGADAGAANPAAAQAPRTTAPRILSEGSRLVQVRGSLVQRDGGWWFVVGDDRPQIAGHEFRMIPDALLADLERAVAAADDDARLELEMTGEVYVFKGRNYLLATHAPVVTPPDDAKPADNGKPASATDAAPATDESDDSTAAILARMQREVGPVARSAEAVASDGATPSQDATSRSTSGSQQGEMLVNRRGQLRRDRGGAWVFILDADASGLADPPLTLVPCQMLEQIVAQDTQNLGGLPMLISGRVLRHHERGYLIPTTYRWPSHRTKIVP